MIEPAGRFADEHPVALALVALARPIGRAIHWPEMWALRTRGVADRSAQAPAEATPVADFLVPVEDVFPGGVVTALLIG